MSMIGNFRSAPDADIEALFEKPGRVVKLLYGADPPGSTGFLSRFRRGSGEPDAWEPTGEGEELDIDKAWQGIHFLLTGTDMGGEPPLDFILRPEDWIGDVDVGYGPARAVRSGEVREISAALGRLPREELAKRFDPERMMELGVYPEIWDRDPAEDDTLGYLLDYYDDLRSFVRRAADRGHGLIVYLN